MEKFFSLTILSLFYHYFSPKKLEFGTHSDNDWLNFAVDTGAKELHIKRCNNVILSDIKDIGNLTVINSKSLKLGIY